MISLGLNHFVNFLSLDRVILSPWLKHSIGTLLLNSGMTDVQPGLCTDGKKHRPAP